MCCTSRQRAGQGALKAHLPSTPPVAACCEDKPPYSCDAESTREEAIESERKEGVWRPGGVRCGAHGLHPHHRASIGSWATETEKTENGKTTLSNRSNTLRGRSECKEHGRALPLRQLWDTSGVIGSKKVKVLALLRPAFLRLTSFAQQMATASAAVAGLAARWPPAQQRARACWAAARLLAWAGAPQGLQPAPWRCSVCCWPQGVGAWVGPSAVPSAA